MIAKEHETKREWLLQGIYKPPVQNYIQFSNAINNILNHY